MTLKPRNNSLPDDAGAGAVQDAIALATRDVALKAAEARPVVLVVHASVGSGHRSAAKAVAQAFDLMQAEVAADGVPAIADEGAEALLETAEVRVLDILDFGRHVFDGNKAATMFTGPTRPFYDLTWRYTLTGRLLWGGGTIWSHLMYAPFTDYVRKTRPVAVVCTHITAANSAVAARMLTGQTFPIVCVPTDYETEGLWPHASCDLICVASESMAETLRPRRLSENRILITGIPTRDDFRHTFDNDQTREALRLPRDKRVVLALAGAFLPQPYIRFRATLDEAMPYLHSLEDDLHFVFVAGNDREYAAHLRAYTADLGLKNVTVMDYVEDMAALMAASDLVICKSGGLTVTECLCAQTPMLLLGRAYGQEKVNVNMLTSQGAAMHATTAREMLDALRHIAAVPQSVESMVIHGRFIRRPDAARDIVKATLDLAAHPKDAGDPLFRKHFLHFYWGGKPAHIR
ncbi:glycosyltransferase [Eggerthellaceae bacterium zg-893]|nr:glycosyltransferase [Eggerthellaceae bacterium zg-893]